MDTTNTITTVTPMRRANNKRRKVRTRPVVAQQAPGTTLSQMLNKQIELTNRMKQAVDRLRVLNTQAIIQANPVNEHHHLQRDTEEASTKAEDEVYKLIEEAYDEIRGYKRRYDTTGENEPAKRMQRLQKDLDEADASSSSSSSESDTGSESDTATQILPDNDGDYQYYAFVRPIQTLRYKVGMYVRYFPNNIYNITETQENMFEIHLNGTLRNLSYENLSSSIYRARRDGFCFIPDTTVVINAFLQGGVIAINIRTFIHPSGCLIMTLLNYLENVDIYPTRDEFAYGSGYVSDRIQANNPIWEIIFRCEDKVMNVASNDEDMKIYNSIEGRPILDPHPIPLYEITDPIPPPNWNRPSSLHQNLGEEPLYQALMNRIRRLGGAARSLARQGFNSDVLGQSTGAQAGIDTPIANRSKYTNNAAAIVSNAAEGIPLHTVRGSESCPIPIDIEGIWSPTTKRFCIYQAIVLGLWCKVFPRRRAKIFSKRDELLHPTPLKELAKVIPNIENTLNYLLSTWNHMLPYFRDVPGITTELMKDGISLVVFILENGMLRRLTEEHDYKGAAHHWIDILIFSNHCYTILDRSITFPNDHHAYYKCQDCTYTFKRSSTYLNHNCAIDARCKACRLIVSDDGKEFHNMYCPCYINKRFVKMELAPVASPKKNSNMEAKIRYEDIAFADIETYMDSNSRHIACAVGYLKGPFPGLNYYHAYTGSACITDFILKCVQDVEISKRNMTVYFHNFQGYDSHILIGPLVRYIKLFPDIRKLSCVGGTSAQRFREIKLTLVQPYDAAKERKPTLSIRFRDSLPFLPMSLAKLTKMFKESAIFMSEVSDIDGVRLDMYNHLVTKNAFPYHLLGPEHEETPLTKIADDKNESIEVREEAKWLIENRIYQKISPLMSDWTALYLNCDVAQLASIFRYVSSILEYELKIPIHEFFGLPGLAYNYWMTSLVDKYHFPSIASEETYIMSNALLRGGYTCAMQRYASNWDGEILYLDVNSLYPFAMMQNIFPSGDEELKVQTITLDALKELYESDASVGAIVVVDLEVIPEDGIPSQFPLAPASIMVTSEHLPDFINAKFKVAPQKVLAAYSGIRRNYVCLIETLMFYLSFGAKVLNPDSIRIMSYTRGAPFTSYIEKMYALRAKSKNNFENLMWKLLMNALFGKTCERVELHEKMRIMTDKEKIKKKINRAGLGARVVLENPDYSILMQSREKCTLTRPIYCGGIITDYAKLHLYRFIYCGLYRIIPDANILYTDTDSLVIQLPHGMCAEMFYNLMNDILRTTPGYENGAFGDKIGQMKNEIKEHTYISEGVFLNAKTYILKLADGTFIRRAKGIMKSIDITFDQYKSVADDIEKIVKVQYEMFHVRDHSISTIHTEKVALTAIDKKRYMIEGSYKTLPLKI